uniref:Uncharacterized protein n=1 Tax=Avena sativa TaxID=4498 RepID=A0ACD5ZRQ9_AVESA
MSRTRLLQSSTTPMSRLCLLRHSSSSTPTSILPPSRSWDPRAAFAAATERVSAGMLSREDAHNLFDELLRQTTLVLERSLNNFFAALARAPSYDDRRIGPALALALFNRVWREEAGTRVAQPTVCTYNIVMDCCCRVRRPDLGIAFFGSILKTGLKIDLVIATTLLKCLCHAKRTDEAVNVLLHRMPELGCVPGPSRTTLF